MRHVRIIAFAAAATFGSAVHAQLDEKTVRQELQTHYAGLVAAYKKRDVKAYVARYTPDVKLTMFDKSTLVSRKALGEWVRGDMADVLAIHSAKLDIHKVTLRPNEVTLEATETWDHKYRDSKGLFGPKGKTYVAIWSQRGTGTYVKTANGWLQKSGKPIGESSFTVGGKPLPPLKK